MPIFAITFEHVLDTLLGFPVCKQANARINVAILSCHSSVATLMSEIRENAAVVSTNTRTYGE